MGQSVAEKLAHQNWCPEVRIASVITGSDGERQSMEGAGPAVASVNRHPERRRPFEGAYCVGQRCMHWDWMTKAGPDQKGFCGLSGRPIR